MIYDKIREAVSKHELLCGVDRVTVACSGGADSIALLDALVQLKNEFGITVAVAHFNHGIRGAEADRDEEFVRAAALKYGIEFFTSKGDVPAFAKEHHLSTELAARKLRYDFLESIAQGGAVATAHTASDNIETMLFNLARGTALGGLCGIPAKRDIYIRPMLMCTREEIEAYCAEHSLEFVTDSTNLSDEYSRNRLRHHAVPVLKGINPVAEESALRTALSLREDECFLEDTANNEYENRITDVGLQLENFDKLSTAIAKRVLKRLYCDCVLASPDYTHITEMYGIALQGGKISLPDGCFAVAQNGILSIGKENKEPSTDFSVDISSKTGNIFKENAKVHNLLLKNTIDCDRIVGKLVLRTRMAGDSIKLPKRGTKTIKKLCTEHKIPLCERENLPVIADDNGVVWVYKLGTAERCLVTEKTERYYKIDVSLK